MKSKILFLLLTLPFIGIAAQTNIKGYVLDSNQAPLEGALVFWEGSTNASTTDAKGYFEIKGTTKDHMLHASLLGYEESVVHVHESTNNLKISLKSLKELDEVVVTKSLGRYSSRVDPMKTEMVTTKELTRAACCSLSESFETNPSVDVSYSDAVTGAKQIQLLGISGTYIQMLTENFPNFRGAAKLYGLDYVPGPWMNSILVSKGSASVKNGYESISGQVDVEYKKPLEADPLSLNIFMSDASRFEANADGVIKLKDNLATGVFAHYSQEKKEHDANDDSFLDMPKRQQINLMNRWHYQNEKFISQSGIKFVNDDRVSGQTEHTLGSHNHSGANPYIIDVKTNRAEIFSKNGYIINPDKNESTALILTGSYHDQKSKYASSVYNVYEYNLYGSWMYEKDFTPMHKLSTGISYNWDEFNESKRIANLQNAGNMPSKETVAGAYAQYTLNWQSLTVLAGLRIDHSSIYDAFVTPRIHVKYNVSDVGGIRLSAGKGYRSVFVLPENSFLLASNRKINIANDLKQEEAWNYGISTDWHIPIGREELAVSAEYFYTDFKNQTVIDMENPTEVNFYNLNGKSYSNSFQVEASYPFFRGFTFLAAYRLNDTKMQYANGQTMKKPLMSDYKAMATASYETKLRKWQFDLTAQFNGGGRMPTPAKDAVTGENLWNETFKPFTIMNAQITKFFKTWSVYIGGENLLDFSQKNPVIAAQDAMNPNSKFDATMVYGPTQGAKFYIGARYNISR